MDGLIAIEVVEAQPDSQRVRPLRVRPGTTLAQAVAQSGFKAADAVGIFGRACDSDTRVSEGDRIEIYRLLINDPKQARRQRAKQA